MYSTDFSFTNENYEECRGGGISYSIRINVQCDMNLNVLCLTLMFVLIDL